jgi:oligopeptidase B
MEQTLKPPIAARRPHRVESPNGVRQDDYYWLRDDTRSNTGVLEYLKAENAYTDSMLAHTKSLQEQFYAEILGRIKQDGSSVPYQKRGYWYYQRFETGKEYPIYARRRGTLDAPEEVMLDGNEMATGHEFFEIGDWKVCPDGRLLAWAEDTAGRRQFTLRFKDLESGTVLSTCIANVEPSIAWTADNRTVVYVSKDPVTLLGYKVRKHALGAHSKDDSLVFEEKDKGFSTTVGNTKDECYILIISRSTVSTEYRVARAHDPVLRFHSLIPRERDHEYEAEHFGNQWILRTNWQAKNFRIVALNEHDIERREKWQDILAHRYDVFVGTFDVFSDFVAVQEYSNGLSNIRIIPWKGKAFLIDSPEPAYTTRLDVNAELDAKLVRYSYSSLTTPPSIYEFDPAQGRKTLLKQDPVLGGFRQSDYVTEHLWATGRDGARIPVSLVYRTGLKRDGSAPMLQYAYGSYGLSTDPSFSHSIISLLDRGFVYAIAHVRGGQELGRGWYENGRLLHKRNTFTDFIDATRYLVQQKYAAVDRVFAMGGSAGGLLMGVVANLAPDEYRGIIALVPFVDVVTTMLDGSIPLTSNELDEWGDPKLSQYYEYMLSYSPYDNVASKGYPALFVSTGLWDGEVQYYEPAKWVAKLRNLKTDSRALLFRINMEAGHGGKSGRFQRYHEIAERYAFILDQVLSDSASAGGSSPSIPKPARHGGGISASDE